MNRFKLGRVGKGVCVDRVVDRAFRPDLFFLFFHVFNCGCILPNLHIWILSCDSVVLRMNDFIDSYQ